MQEWGHNMTTILTVINLFYLNGDTVIVNVYKENTYLFTLPTVIVGEGVIDGEVIYYNILVRGIINGGRWKNVRKNAKSGQKPH